MSSAKYLRESTDHLPGDAKVRPSQISRIAYVPRPTDPETSGGAPSSAVVPRRVGSPSCAPCLLTLLCNQISAIRCSSSLFFVSSGSPLTASPESIRLLASGLLVFKIGTVVTTSSMTFSSAATSSRYVIVAPRSLYFNKISGFSVLTVSVFSSSLSSPSRARTSSAHREKCPAVPVADVAD